MPRNYDEAFLDRAISAGAGDRPADLVIKGVQLFSVVDGSTTTTDIAISDDRIVGTHDTYEGVETIDGAGLTAVPGFIDTHLHVESSLLTPFEFDRCVLPHGVTTAICDPHEIANVLGAEGIKYFLDSSLETVMDLKVNLSSCVPATAFETAGACLEIEDLLPFKDHPSVIGLAEFMNFPGVLARDPKVLAKLAAFQDGHIDGHVPLVRGMTLNGYLAAGIRTDHESTSAPEALEKLAKGMSVLMREGSVCKDLDSLAPIVTPDTSSFVALCTDDRNPLDIAEEGHLDSMIRRLIAKGIRPLDAYRVASWSAANAFGLKDRGVIAPGKRADIVLLKDFEDCQVETAICGGVVANDAAFAARTVVAPVGLDSVNVSGITAGSFEIPARNSEADVIGIIPGQVITEHLKCMLPVDGGQTVMDFDQDVIKVAVVERHKGTGNIGKGFVKGFGMKKGAIASSVGHDSHNICVVGADEEAMAHAVKRVIEMKGGFAVADKDGVKAELALPLAGLMSLNSFETVRQDLVELRATAKAIGCTLEEPFLQVSFLPLAVIPHLKITDLGVFDVNRFELVDQGS